MLITIFSITRRTMCTNMRLFFTFKNTSTFSYKQCSMYINFLIPQQNLNSVICKRLKSKGKTPKQSGYEEDANDDGLDVDDYLSTDKSKVFNTTIASLRLDAVAKSGFGISRAKLDKEFYKSNLRINGQKCLKKSTMIQIGDEIDHIQSRSPDNPNYLIVNRCVLLKVDPDPETGVIHARFVQNKSLLIEDYRDKWHKD